MSDVVWLAVPFAELNARQVYQMLALRSSVFVVEQRCLYQDIDGLDLASVCVLGVQSAADAGSQVIATARILPPGTRFDEASIGRVCTAAAHRGRGLGRALMRQAVGTVQAAYPGQRIRISAQAYLETFYRGLGFVVASAPYLEDGIAHLEMILASATSAPASGA